MASSNAVTACSGASRDDRFSFFFLLKRFMAFRPPKLLRNFVVLNYLPALVEMLSAGADQSGVSALTDPKACGILGENRFEHCDGVRRPDPFVLSRHFRESTSFGGL